jgi:hypothetical protein
MSYVANLQLDGVKSNYLIILKPRRRVTDISFLSGSIYSADFDFGEVVTITYDGTEKTKASSSALSDGSWYWSLGDNKLYLKDLGGTPLDVFITVTYELYMATFDASWFKDPLDDTSRTVYWEPVILKSPGIVKSATDTIFGYMPTTSGSITLSESTGFLSRHLYGSSFNLADIDMFHYVEDLSLDNIKLVYKGTTKDVRYTDKEISLSITDRNDVLNNEWRLAGERNFFNFTDFPKLDPSAENAPIRYFYGRNFGVIPTNIDYETASPTTSLNRYWAVGISPGTKADIQAFAVASPVSTTTRTYLDSVNGFAVGEEVFIFSNYGGGQSDYRIVTAVGADYIEHAALSYPGLTGVGNGWVKRPSITNVRLFKNNVLYKINHTQHFYVFEDATTKVFGIQLLNGIETGLGLADPIGASDLIFCDVYGDVTNLNFAGASYTTTYQPTGNLTNPAVILWDILTRAGIKEADLDAAAFTALEASFADKAISFSVPFNGENSFPTYKDIVIKILQSMFWRLILNDSGKWTLSNLVDISSLTSDALIYDEDIIKNSFNYDLNYSELLSETICRYRPRAASETGARNLTYSQKTATSKTAEYLHLTSKQKTLDTVILEDLTAQSFADKYISIFGDRAGRAKLNAKLKYFPLVLGNILEVIRLRLPGYAFQEGTTRSRKFTILSTNKTLNEIQIELDDQKGIEENNTIW